MENIVKKKTAKQLFVVSAVMLATCGSFYGSENENEGSKNELIIELKKNEESCDGSKKENELTIEEKEDEESGDGSKKKNELTIEMKEGDIIYNGKKGVKTPICCCCDFCLNGNKDGLPEYSELGSEKEAENNKKDNL